MKTEEESTWGMLMDLVLDGACRMWFYLEEFNLSLSRVNEEAEPPGWLQNELWAAGWDEILEIPYDDMERAQWALEHGIAPGQAFLMEVRPPHYFRCGNPMDGEDWDVEYRSEFLRAEPWHAESAASQWEEWIKAGYPEAIDESSDTYHHR